MHKLAIFASGNGTNAQRIIEFFADHVDICIDLVLSNNRGAFVLSRAEKFGIPAITFSRTEFYQQNTVFQLLACRNIDYIILAGFMWLIPESLLTAYPGHILNIHPAILPKFGGKGMYGHHVHEAVIAARETESGITIHYVNDRYDEGQIIFQAKCTVDLTDTPDSLAGKVHELEHRFYPEIIKKVIEGSL